MGRGVVYDTVHVTGLTVISVLSIVTNFIFIKVRLKTHESNQGSMHLAVSFAVSNLLISTVAAPLSLIADFEVFEINPFACVALNSPALMSLTLPLSFLFAMTVERGISIFCPLRYPAIVTSSRTRKVTILIWVYGIVCLIIPMLGANSIADRQRRQLNFTACNMAYVMTGTYVCFVTMGNAAPTMTILLGLNLAIGIIVTKRYKEETSVKLLFAPLDVLLKLKKAQRQRKLIIALLLVGQLYFASHVLLLAALIIDYRGFHYSNNNNLGCSI
ncbi:adenosine receptor A2b-like [Haliotis rubra]|uniref:adenosine receptor A2b-like n=1 Tax=Haliotis rubra TaxID=36100 RepID=UPI001EE536FD|nr:adenosine receptor A2b-like [Haliotis rubra]